MQNRFLPQVQDWGLAHERMRQFVKRLRDLPCHVVCTALQQIEKDEVTGSVIGGINLPGKMSGEIPPLFNLVTRMVIEPKANAKPSYYMSVIPTTLFPAGDKTGALAYKEVPDFRIFWPKIQAATTNKEEEKK